MSTVSEIVKEAFREGNFIAVGEDPTPEELAEAIPRLRNLVDSLFGVEIGEKYRDWYVPSDLSTSVPLRSPLTPTGISNGASAPSWQYPPANVRLLVKTAEARSVYLPANPSDGARVQFINIASTVGVNVTIDGNGHLVENAVSVTDTVANLNGRRWFYRADTANWVKLESIADENSTLPLPEEFNDYFVCGLAIRLSTRFQVKVDDATVARFADMAKRIKNRYKQTEAMPAGHGDLNSSIAAHSTSMGL
jgi:hypothetical protein